MSNSKKIFWFSKIGTKDSFSRISEAIIPLLKQKGYTITTIIPPSLEYTNDFLTILRMGQPIHTKLIDMTMEKFMTNVHMNLGSQMNYIILQTLAHCVENEIPNLFVTMGAYEANWIMNMIGQIRAVYPQLTETKLIFYVPFDYIPDADTVKYLVKADQVITTMPYMVDILKSLGANAATTWIEHGTDQKSFKELPKNHETLVSLTNAMKGRFWKSSRPIELDEIIILNANLYGERKRIQATVDAFAEVQKRYPKIRLWLHGTKPELILNQGVEDIIYSNKVSNSELNLIYNISKIGLQTSWGEGWSLTNCEHALVGGLQVVPKFLACGFHFGSNRGITIPVTSTDFTNEGNHNVKIGITTHENIVNSLGVALDMIKHVETDSDSDSEYDKSHADVYSKQATSDYIASYTWESACDKIANLLV